MIDELTKGLTIVQEGVAYFMVIDPYEADEHTHKVRVMRTAPEQRTSTSDIRVSHSMLKDQPDRMIEVIRRSAERGFINLLMQDEGINKE